MKDAGAQLERWGRRVGLEPLDLWFLGLHPRGDAGGGHRVLGPGAGLDTSAPASDPGDVPGVQRSGKRHGRLGRL